MRLSVKRGFTLIELLIVVAIIAILAAIAVPNFLEAQVRSKVSRTRADMRSLVTAIEAYRVDNNQYPKCNNFGLAGARFDPNEQGDPTRLVLERISTPIAYITNSFLPDPFDAQQRTGTINPTTGDFTPSPTVAGPNRPLERLIKYFTPQPGPGNQTLADVENPAETQTYYYILASTGPDRIYPNAAGLLLRTVTEEALLSHIYDPTNGTVSRGNIFRVSGATTGRENNGGLLYEMVQGR